LGAHFAEYIQDHNLKVIVRPDSGDAVKLVPQVLEVLSKYFPREVNSKGYYTFRDVGVIQGDGIDLDTLKKIAYKVMDHNYAAETVVYGSGGGLLQKLNRDTYKFAQKTSAMLIDGKWVDTVKNPVTDPGKRSKGGRMTIPDGVCYYLNGVARHFENLLDIRERACSSL
jgi:nicotinamide phosphoribosyltransferase